MKKSIITTAIAALALAGCTGEENTSEAYVPEGTPIRVNTYVADMQTRAGYDETKGPQRFYLDITNKDKTKYSYNALMVRNSAGAWESFDAKDETKAMPMYWAGDNNPVEVTAATFPASEMTTGVGVESDQTSDDNFNSSDKLRMKATPKDPNPDGIEVKLTHLMAKVKLEIDLGEDDDYQTNPLTKVAIGGTELKRTCAETTTGYAFTSLDPAVTGDITPWTGEGDFTPTNKTTSSKTNAKARYEAILVPQTAKAGKFTIGLTLTGGKEFLWTAASDVELKSNYEYTLSLRLYGDKLLLGDVSVDAWGTGKLDGGVVEADNTLCTLTVTEAGQVTANSIKAALKSHTRLKVVGPLKVEDVEALKNYSNITYLDLTETTFNDIFYSSPYFFSGADKLETIKLPETMTVIGSEAFSGCGALTSIVMPSNLEEIKEKAFEGCGSLTEITIPSKVTAIPNRCFENCQKLTKVTFEGAVESIGNEAFCKCHSLKYMYLEKCTTGLPTLGTDVFNGVNEPINVYLSDDLYNKIDNGTVPKWSGDFNFTTTKESQEE